MSEDRTEFEWRKTWELERDKERKVEALNDAMLKRQTNDFYNSVGQVLRKYRLQKKLSQHSVAQKLGINENEWYKMENGDRKITLFMFMRACSLLDIDFRFSNRFALEEKELEWIKAFRKRDYKYLLTQIASEI